MVYELNKNMGGLTFGKDGDGNYGYYGADGSLVPFRSTEVICLGTGTSFDVSTYKGYENFTVNNFILAYDAPTATVNTTIIRCNPSQGDLSDHVYPSASVSVPSASYNAFTGNLTITNGSAKTKYTRHSSSESGTISTITLKVIVYLVIGHIS